MRRTVRGITATALVMSALIGVARPAEAGTTDATYRRKLASIASVIAHRPAARGSTPGVVVFRNGREVYASNADSALAPASLLKILTTTAAVLRFGADHRFVTKVVASVAPAGGIVAGDLAVIGGGDPTLATASWAARHLRRDAPRGKVAVFPSGSPTIEALAAKIAAAGVTKVDGDLIADESLFDSSRWQRGWLASYQHGDIDVGNLSALQVNTGMDAAGRRVAPSPAVLTATLLRDSLKARKVSVTGAVRVGHAPTDAVDVTSVSSPPLAEIVGWTNRWSINYAAEMLLKSLGAAFGGKGTTPAGAAVIRSTLWRYGIDVRGLRMEDGSGLSLLDRVTPRTIGQTLRLMTSLDGAAGLSLRNSLPVAGRAGTLLHRMGSAPTGGNLRGKTGLIKGVRALAGWVRTKDGSLVVYVALFNRVRSPLRMTSVLDAFGRALATLPS